MCNILFNIHVCIGIYIYVPSMDSQLITITYRKIIERYYTLNIIYSGILTVYGFIRFHITQLGTFRNYIKVNV